MINASTVSKVESSQSKAKHAEALNKQSSGDKINETFVHVESQLEKLNKLNFVDIKSRTKPANPVHQASTESLLLPEPPSPEVEIKDSREEYTGFTIAYKDSSVVLLKLRRQDSLRTLKAIVDIPKKAEDEKLEDSREVIDIFSDARIGTIVPLQPNPYSSPEQIWTGLEVSVMKNDEIKTYVLVTRGLAKWIIDEPKLGWCSVASDDSGLINPWNVATAEIVREKGKGPYLKLNIDKENAVCLKPKKASDQDLKRFMTPLNFSEKSPSTDATEEEVRLSPKVEILT